MALVFLPLVLIIEFFVLYVADDDFDLYVCRCALFVSALLLRFLWVLWRYLTQLEEFREEDYYYRIPDDELLHRPRPGSHRR